MDEDVIGRAVDVAHRVVWATVVTVDGAGRPRARVLHPIWTTVDGGVQGLVITRPTPLKRRHLDAHPHVTCAYLGPDHSFAHFDCDAELVDDAGTRRRAWDAFAAAPEPLGYDFAAVFPDGPDSEGMVVLRMRPYRVRVASADAVARGETPLLWVSSPRAA